MKVGRYRCLSQAMLTIRLHSSMGNVQCELDVSVELSKLTISTLSTSIVYPDGSRPDMVRPLSLNI